MSNFNDQLSRMKDLINYGSVNEEAKPISTYSLEYKAQAADGKYYGIIRENSKYFVKVATPGKETIAEAYQYIGGVMNKANYEYNSYTNALKQFELKLGSINEAYDENRKVNVEALDPYKKEDLVIEGTEKMKNELARQRQIMRNACVIMNEATEIGIGKTPYKNQPEAEHDNSGDKDYPFTKEGKPEADRGAIKFDGGDPEKHSATFGPDSNDVEDYNLDKGKTPKVSGSVASENPKGGKVARVNEAYEGTGLDKDFNGGTAKIINISNDKHPEGVEVKNNNGETVFVPAEDIKIWGEDQIAVSQEAYDRLMNGDGEGEMSGDVDECSTGLMPEEGEEDLELGDEPVDTEELGSKEGLGDEEEMEPEMGDELGDEEAELGDEEDLGDDEDFDLGDEEELGDEEDLDDDEFDFDEEDDEFGDEDELDLDDEDELDDDEEFDEDDDEFEEEPEEGEFDDEEDPEIELDENVVKKFRQLVRESINEMFGDEFKSSVAKPYGMSDDEYFSSDDEEDEFDDEGYDEERYPEPMNEAKAAKMNSIVESVVNDILNEDELHVFGDHPGYRKKPFTLPQTGEDKFQVNRDWNDESVYSEEPFGKGKGDSTPFDELVGQITDSVMKQINEGKKKVK